MASDHETITSVASRKFGGTKRCHRGMPRKDAESDVHWRCTDSRRRAAGDASTAGELLTGPARGPQRPRAPIAREWRFTPEGWESGAKLRRTRGR